jgi:hypothetical protein
LEENPVKLGIESENAVLDSDPVTNMGEEGADKQAPTSSKTEAKETRLQQPRLGRQRWARTTGMRRREGEQARGGQAQAGRTGQPAHWAAMVRKVSLFIFFLFFNTIFKMNF